MMTFTRQRTNREILDIDWNYPKSIEIEPSDDEYTAVEVRMSALPFAEALAKVVDGDRRPLLVLRECDSCKGTDDALLSTKLDNEKTVLLTRWFKCVKLRPNVTEPNHTYHELFGGQAPPHLFLATPDGEMVIPLDGRQSQALLWEDMGRVLARCYEEDPEEAIKQIFRVMAKYDTLDSQEDQIREQLEAEIEKRGQKSPKVERLQARLAKIAKERERVEREQAEAEDLGLRTED